MRSFLFFIDRVSWWAGHTVSWLIVLLTGIIVYSVVWRYVFRDPPLWAYDASLILFGTHFMMGGAYALSRNAHVRGDMFYRDWPVRVQATIDLALFILFFFPGIIALTWAGWEFAEVSRFRNELSNQSPIGIIIWPYKYVMPIASAFMLLQGIAETIRCIQALKTGEWPARLADVEETETRLAKESQF